MPQPAQPVGPGRPFHFEKVMGHLHSKSTQGEFYKHTRWIQGKLKEEVKIKVKKLRLKSYDPFAFNSRRWILFNEKDSRVSKIIANSTEQYSLKKTKIFQNKQKKDGQIFKIRM